MQKSRNIKNSVSSDIAARSAPRQNGLIHSRWMRVGVKESGRFFLLSSGRVHSGSVAMPGSSLSASSLSSSEMTSEETVALSVCRNYVDENEACVLVILQTERIRCAADAL